MSDSKERPQHEHREAQDRAISETYRSFAREGVPASERLTLVAKVLAGFEHLLAQEQDSDRRVAIAAKVMELLQFAASDFARGMAPLIDAFPNGFENASPRRQLRWLLQVTMLALMPQARNGDEPVLVPMPAKLAHDLLDALCALDAGEVPELLMPAPSPKHGPEYTWQKARVRALQHVAFLVGQGFPKGTARQRVQVATGIKTDTLRAWERELSADLETAVEAGRVETIERDGRARPSPMDAHVDQLLSELRREPLAAFGAYYRQTFGGRHWGGGGDRGTIATTKAGEIEG